MGGTSLLDRKECNESGCDQDNKDGRDACPEFAIIVIARAIDVTDHIAKVGRVEIDIIGIKGRHDCDISNCYISADWS